MVYGECGNVYNFPENVIQVFFQGFQHGSRIGAVKKQVTTCFIYRVTEYAGRLDRHTPDIRSHEGVQVSPFYSPKNMENLGIFVPKFLQLGCPYGFCLGFPHNSASFLSGFSFFYCTVQFIPHSSRSFILTFLSITYFQKYESIMFLI